MSANFGVGSQQAPIENNNISIASLLGDQDWDPRKVNYAYIFMMVLVASGMSPIEQQMAAIAKYQSVIDSLDGNVIDFSAIISQLETDSGKSGFTGGNNSLSGLVAELKSFFKNTFGSGFTVTTIAGQQVVLPTGRFSTNGQFVAASGTSYGAFINSWEAQNPGKGITGLLNSPAFSSLNGFAKTLIDTPPNTSISGTWAGYMSGKNTTSGGFSGLINTACKNYYLTNNPPSGGNPPTTNPLKDLYTFSSASQGALQGLGSQNTATIQTDTSSETSLDQTGQNAISQDNQALNAMIQNEKSS